MMLLINPKPLKYLICLVGPSGSGKTTLINIALEKLSSVKRVKSTTTRPKRGPEDDEFYEFLTPDEFESRAQIASFLNIEDYAGYRYASDKSKVFSILNTHHGIMAMVESSIKKLQDAQVPIKVVKITPVNQNVFRGEARISNDIERAKIPIHVDFEITNTFEPGGADKASAELIKFIESL